MVVDRKGEHAEVFEQLRGQGFVRVRVDGRVHETRRPAEDRPKKKHTIEAVVDRFGSRAGCRHAPGGVARDRARAGRRHRAPRPYEAEKAQAGDEVLFSARQACPVCGYSVATLEPKMFSFNSPAGACPTCDGLGLKEFFDPARVVAYPHLSLAGGAIKSWDRKNAYYFAMITAHGAALQVRSRDAVEGLPKKAQQMMLFGSGDDEVEFRYVARQGAPRARKHRFEGIIPNLERRYKETDSLPVREELGEVSSARSPAPTARARGSIARRAMCSSARTRCRRSRT